MTHWTNSLPLKACDDVRDWARSYDTPQAAWDACERGDWMLWLLGSLAGPPESKSRKRLVLCACACAKLSLPYVAEGETRPRIAIETAEAWARDDGNATLSDVLHASGAALFAYAAAGATNDAYAVYAAYTAITVHTTIAYAAAGALTPTQCAEIVRQHYPQAPNLDHA